MCETRIFMHTFNLNSISQMKRKFFSALLLMTLSVASVGMLVSCKDYDDDINSVRDDVTSLRNELESAKTDLEQQLPDAQGSFAAQIQEAVEGKADQDYVDELNQQLDARVSALETQMKAVDDALTALGDGDIEQGLAVLASITGDVSDLKDRVGAVETNLQLQTEALMNMLEKLQNSNYKDVQGLIDALDDANGALAAIKEGLGVDDEAALKEAMENAKETLDKLNEVVPGLSAQIDILTLYIERMLSSLVFAPDFYYGGIEAMEATTISYVPVLLNNDSPAEKPLSTGETWDGASAATSLTPDVTARYHMNPSYFDVSKIKSMSVVSGDKEYVQLGGTRAAESNPTVVDKSWLNSKDGMLNVTLNLDASKIKDDADHVSVLAVQAHFNDAEGNDTTVTSDYAAVAKSTIKDVVIADATIDGNSSCTANENFHVYTTAAQAISNNYTHDLIYNDPEGVDLMKVVEAHFKRNSSTTESVMDDVTKYGMKWEFAESHYTAGDNKTSESAHIYLKDNHVIACTVDANGKPQPGNQDRSTLERRPMVRVTLVDTTKTTNNIVAVGFIKFRITEKEAEPADAINIDFDGNGYDLSCTDYNFTQTWAQVENKVLSQLNMSKEEFEKNYTVEKISGSQTNCQLYAHNDKGEIVKSTQYGTVTEKVDDQSHETSVLSWDITAADIYAAVWDVAKNAYKTGVNLETGVKFVPTNKLNPEVYVWFHTGVITTPTASLSNDDKIKENWAATNGQMGSGYAEIHNNVEVVDQPDADDEFSQDILATFVGNDITLDITGSDAFKTGLDYTFKFIVSDAYRTQIGQSGNKYTMSVSADGQILYANYNGTSQEVAKLGVTFDDVTSKQSINSVVQYQASEYAKDLLNAVSHKDIAKTVTATVGIYAVNGCDMQLPIANNTFDIKFLRPLDVTGAEAVTFTDAVTGGNKKDMAELVDFLDWRDQWQESWVDYYGVTSIAADVDGITTTLNGGKLGETLLSDVTDAVSFEYNSTGAEKKYGNNDFGYLYYGNNGSVTAKFQIRVPLTITYDWGEITTAYVDITVEPTQANRAARR